LGKKKYRVETARRLVFGSMISSHEKSKTILFAPDQGRGALFRVLDPSLPFWAERDLWARWMNVSGHEELLIGQDGSSQVSFSDCLQRLLVAPQRRGDDVKQFISFEKAIQSLLFPQGSENKGTRRSVVAMYLSLLGH
jgi:hypothetical protein